MAKETVRVRIHATQQLRFDQIVNMDKEKWEEIVASGDMPEGDDVDSYLDINDPADWDDVEVEDIYACDEEGKIIRAK